MEEKKTPLAASTFSVLTFYLRVNLKNMVILKYLSKKGKYQFLDFSIAEAYTLQF